MKRQFLSVFLILTTFDHSFTEDVPQHADNAKVQYFYEKLDAMAEAFRHKEKSTSSEIQRLEHIVGEQMQAISRLGKELEGERQKNEGLREQLSLLLRTGGKTESNRQTRADDYGALQAMVNQMTEQVSKMEADIVALQNADNDIGDRLNQQDTAIAAQGEARGAVYTRWGHSECPETAELVYTGSVAGSHYSMSGGAANQLCLPHNPVFDGHTPNMSFGTALIYGTEYETCPEPECQLTPACAVCRATRSTTVMVPGTSVCASGWTLEYSGYIMAGRARVDHLAPTEYICVDSSRKYLPGSATDENENVLYYAIFKCGSLSCPPYENNKVALCAVCSK